MAGHSKRASEENALDELRAGKRWSDLARALEERVGSLEGAMAVKDYNELGELMMDRFANHAEAMRFFEASLAIEREQPDIEQRLRILYEKRRDWEALRGLARTPQERALLDKRHPRDKRSLWQRLFG